MTFANPAARKVKCTKCGKEETEMVWGAGFTGWQVIREILDEKNANPILCPVCLKIVIDWLNGGKENGLDNSKLLGS